MYRDASGLDYLTVEVEVRPGHGSPDTVVVAVWHYAVMRPSQDGLPVTEQRIIGELHLPKSPGVEGSITLFPEYGGGTINVSTVAQAAALAATTPIGNLARDAYIKTLIAMAQEPAAKPSPKPHRPPSSIADGWPSHCEIGPDYSRTPPQILNGIRIEHLWSEGGWSSAWAVYGSNGLVENGLIVAGVFAGGAGGNPFPGLWNPPQIGPRPPQNPPGDGGPGGGGGPPGGGGGGPGWSPAFNPPPPGGFGGQLIPGGEARRGMLLIIHRFISPREVGGRLRHP